MDSNRKPKTTTKSSNLAKKGDLPKHPPINQFRQLLWLISPNVISDHSTQMLKELETESQRLLKEGKKKKKKNAEAATDRCLDNFDLCVRRVAEMGKQRGTGITAETVMVQGVLLLAFAYLLPNQAASRGERQLPQQKEPAIDTMPSPADVEQPVNRSIDFGKTISQALQLKLPKVGWPLQPWVEQIILTELPLVLARRFPDLVVAEDWVPAAIDGMSRLIDELLDSDGWPIAEALPMFGPLLISWCRCVGWLNSREISLETKETLQGGIRQLWRLIKPNGELMFAEPAGAIFEEDAVKFFLKHTDDRSDRNFARLGAGWNSNSKQAQSSRSSLFKQCVKGKFPLTNSSPSKQKERLDPSLSPCNVSEFGESGVLRSSWDWCASSVGIRFDNSQISMEISRFAPLITGSSLPGVWLNQQQLNPISPFEVLCEYHDEDVDYLEIQITLESQVSLIRQVLLSHQENFVFVADSITAEFPGELKYECNWRLAEGTLAMSETETREHYLLVSDSIHALLLPLSLPEWQQGPTNGKFLIREGGLQLTDSHFGGGMYVPLVIDLCPRRSRRKRTWRQLTVAEARQVIQRDVAQAFRFQLDKEQWICYRTLQQKGNRTFLGENFNGEFLLARFGKDGSVKELIRIE